MAQKYDAEQRQMRKHLDTKSALCVCAATQAAAVIATTAPKLTPASDATPLPTPLPAAKPLVAKPAATVAAAVVKTIAAVPKATVLAVPKATVANPLATPKSTASVITPVNSTRPHNSKWAFR